MITACFALFPCYILLHHLYKRFSPEREREREGQRQTERDLDKEHHQITESTRPSALGFKSRTAGPDGTILIIIKIIIIIIIIIMKNRVP